MVFYLSMTGCTQAQEKECRGNFRWDVKTLTDDKGIDLLSLIPSDSTISQIVSVQAPVRMFVLSEKDGRLPRFDSEKHLVKIIALVEKMNIQADEDYHIVLRSPDSKASMIGEIPDPGCAIFDSLPRLKMTYRESRAQLKRVT